VRSAPTLPRNKLGEPANPSHRRAITDILACRTASLGGHLWQCDHCSEEVFSYHSCNNRSCSKCHTADTERWLQARKLEMLPCHHFHVTVTVPQELRQVLRTNQQDGYALLNPSMENGQHSHGAADEAGVARNINDGVRRGLHPCWHPARPSYLAPETAIAKLGGLRKSAPISSFQPVPGEYRGSSGSPPRSPAAVALRSPAPRPSAARKKSELSFWNRNPF
jgi:Transposase zinc-binding domain